jgi:phytanoyl-CoA hydroxylase
VLSLRLFSQTCKRNEEHTSSCDSNAGNDDSELFANILDDTSASDLVTSQLHSKGFAIASPHPFLSPATCNFLNNTTIPNLFRGNFDTNVYPDEWHWREGISRDDAAREMCNTWKSSQKVASVVLHERIGQFVARVMGWDSVRIAQDDLVWKPPQQKQKQKQKQKQSLLNSSPSRHDLRRIDTVGFHQDSAYISTQFQPYENNSVTVWIALDDADEENGCLEYAVGSHLWRPISHLHRSRSRSRSTRRRQNADDNPDRDADCTNSTVASFHDSDESSYRNGLLSAARMADIEIDAKNPYSIIESVPAKMGHAVLHHQDVWHGSGPNTSNTRHRRALVAHYLRGDVKFIDDNSEGGDNGNFRPPFGKTSYIYGRYKRFKSIEVDETFFPIIYSSIGENEEGLKRTEWLDEFVSKSW